MLSEVEQEQRPSGNGDREAIVVGAGLCNGEGERAYTEYAPTLEGESTENLLPKRLSPAVKTFRHQRRFGNKKLPKRLPPSCCRNVLCRNVRNPLDDVNEVDDQIRDFTPEIDDINLPFQSEGLAKKMPPGAKFGKWVISQKSGITGFEINNMCRAMRRFAGLKYDQIEANDKLNYMT